MSTFGEDFTYSCQRPEDVASCASTCVSLETCEDCDCAVVSTEASGPWGDFMDVAFCLAPIIFLLYATIKPNPMPTTRSLPIAALFMWLVRLMYLGSDPLLTSAAVVLGLHEALTPLSIMAGAIMLFETMEATYCLPYMMREMKALTGGHPVAELMLYVMMVTFFSIVLLLSHYRSWRPDTPHSFLSRFLQYFLLCLHGGRSLGVWHSCCSRGSNARVGGTPRLRGRCGSSHL
jgi:hypothetical protein